MLVFSSLCSDHCSSRPVESQRKRTPSNAQPTRSLSDAEQGYSFSIRFTEAGGNALTMGRPKQDTAPVGNSPARETWIQPVVGEDIWAGH